MIHALYYIIWGFFGLIPLLILRFHLFSMDLTIDLISILVIAVAFSGNFFSSVITVVFFAFMVTTFSIVDFGDLVIVYLIICSIIKLVLDLIYTEAYLTKSLWVFAFSFVIYTLVGVIFDVTDLVLSNPLFWLQTIIQSLLNAMVSFPFLILLDNLINPWLALFGRKRAQLTGADLYQSQSHQRKYF